MGQTPLHAAAGSGYWESVQILLENGAQPNTKNRVGYTALFLAKERDQEKYYQDARREISDKAYPGADYDKTIEVLKEHGAME